MAELTDKEAVEVFNEQLTSTDNPGHEIEILQIVDYRDSKIYIRMIDAGVGKVFEFLLTYDGEIQGFSRLVTPAKGKKLTEEEISRVTALMMATATKSVDTLLDKDK